ncbi:MAG: protein kinase [Deltaproteobacteria bacterium]|nr:protein kinase [Deltaproteobacteria bacterium]
MGAQQIDRYVLKGQLGEGAMGRVYLAYDPKFNREVALKIIKDTMQGDERVRKWFHREARAMAQLQHPGIVEVHDYSGQEAAEPYLVMERLHGHTLKDVLEARGVCSGPVLCELAIQLGQALEHAHGQGLVHRDLKPDNLFVEPNGRIVITDFGLARAQMNVDLGASLASMGTSVVGTPLFLAPEAIHDPKEAGPKSDLYAVGVILYYAASLKMPFQADDPFQALSRILSGQHVRVHEHRKDLPPAVCDAIERTFAFDPQKRPQNGAALEALFAKIRDQVAPGTDSLPALVTFLQQTEEFNSFTQATHINLNEVQIRTPGETTQVDRIDMTTEPGPITVNPPVSPVPATTQIVTQPSAATQATTLQQIKDLGDRAVDKTVVASRTHVVTAPRTQVVTATSETKAAPSRSGVLIAIVAVVAVAIVAGVFLWQQRRAPKPPPPVTQLPVETPPSDPPKTDALPPPAPSEALPVPDLPKAQPPPVEPKRKLEPGTLKVNTGPIWADIFVNGEKRGQTPFKGAIELQPGKYKVRLVNPDYGAQEHSVTITSGETTPLKVTLDKK